MQINSRHLSVLYRLLFIVVFLCSTPVQATTNVGTAGAQFLKIGPGARVDSLGGAFGALANDVTTIYWNPAGLSQIKELSFSDTHTIWLADIRYNYLAFATPIEQVGTLGASVTFLNVPDTEITTLAKPDGTGLWFSRHGMLRYRWLIPDSSTKKNRGSNSPSVSTPNTSTSRSIGNVPQEWRLMSAPYITQAGAACELGCASRILDRRCVSVDQILKQVLKKQAIREPPTIAHSQIRRTRRERQSWKP